MARLADLYDAMWSAGEAFGIADFGVHAVDSLHMEKAYRGWGVELTNEITLVEADMERFAAFDKDDFIGKTAMQRVKQAGIVTWLVYVEVEPSDCDVHGGEPVIADGKVVGSRLPAPTATLRARASASPTWSLALRRRARHSPSTSSASRARRRCSPTIRATSVCGREPAPIASSG